MTARLLLLLAVVLSASPWAMAQPLTNSKHVDPTDKFFQIESWLPTASDVRTASGAPGPEYWQQRADYDIEVTLDDQHQQIVGRMKMTYHNRSPHELTYLWMQLDQNHYSPSSDTVLTSGAPRLQPRIDFDSMAAILARESFEGGYKIASVTDALGEKMKHTIVKTMMRLDLAKPLPPGGSTEVQIQYSYNIIDAKMIRGRGGYEYFKDDKNYIYEIAQWHPRATAYTDYQGWQHKQFLGQGEFTLEFGDYDVRITVPSDMIVAATGELQNMDACLTKVQQERLQAAKTAESPVYVVTHDEAKENQSDKSPDREDTKTWVYRATNVRDFAFAASRKFAWDAMGVRQGERTVMAMSFFPIEANPLWHQYSTEAVVHTIEVYGRYTFEYPYPYAISVNGPVYGMEYPMICFNGPRPESDGTYTKDTKYGLISVIIHEVGHNYFPMIVNSDERTWTWMDEGINTFLQFLAEQEWEPDYPCRRGSPENIADYMRGGNQRPIMTGSEEILQFGNNAYAKPAAALNILRETILGRELFDSALIEYARRWKFKRPTPADFFRTMEDASGVDLDWFWRGWFYGTDHVDIGVTHVEQFNIDRGDPEEESERKRKEKNDIEPDLTKQRNQGLQTRVDLNPGLKDFYNSDQYDELAVKDEDLKTFQEFMDSLDADQRSLLRRTTNFYIATFMNSGGLVMPIIARLHFEDGSTQMTRLPAEVWRFDSREVKKMFMTEKALLRIEIDPFRETADVNKSNNQWPPKIEPSRFRLFKDKVEKNEMQRIADKEKEAVKKEENKKAEPNKDDK
jgi:Peptidase family M1 domain